MSGAFIRIYYEIAGGHVHMRVFVGTGSKSGNLVVTVKEWPTFKERMLMAKAQLIDETKEQG